MESRSQFSMKTLPVYFLSFLNSRSYGRRWWYSSYKNITLVRLWTFLNISTSLLLLAGLSSQYIVYFSLIFLIYLSFFFRKVIYRSKRFIYDFSLQNKSDLRASLKISNFFAQFKCACMTKKMIKRWYFPLNSAII